MTLGIVGQDRFPHQLGQNEAWNHAGNLFSAILAGICGYIWELTAVLLLMTLMALAAIISTLMISKEEIDHNVPRGVEHNSQQTEITMPSGFYVLTKSVPLKVLGMTMLLFHLANAAMLPLLGQSIVSQKLANPSLFTALTIVIAQLVMIPVALMAARIAGSKGYWPLVMLAMLELPIRGLIAGYWNSPYAVLPVQILDGLGAGLLGVATPGIVARILKGSGHINAGQGAVMTLQGIGAALSPALAGAIANYYSYSTAFIGLGIIATFGLLLWWNMRATFAAA